MARIKKPQKQHIFNKDGTPSNQMMIWLKSLPNTVANKATKPDPGTAGNIVIIDSDGDITDGGTIDGDSSLVSSEYISGRFLTENTVPEAGTESGHHLGNRRIEGDLEVDDNFEVAGNGTIGGNLTIGDGSPATDFTLTFDGETNDAIITWMEDEDYLLYSDDILMYSGAQIFFRDTNSYIYSGGANLISIVAQDLQLYSNAIDLGRNGVDSDTVLQFMSNTNDGVITWKNTEDYFEFSDIVNLAGNRILEVGDPEDENDATNVKYVAERYITEPPLHEASEIEDRVHVATSQSCTITSSTYTFGTNRETILLCNTDANAITVTMPTYSSKICYVKNSGSSGNDVTISNEVDGVADQSIADGECATLITDTSEGWVII